MKRSQPKPLPAFIQPMLAVLVEPFESDRHLYEIKWDGFRSLCFVDSAGNRLVGRRETDFTTRFPELDVLAKLPRGTVLDGEIVQLTDGKPDFQSLLARERSWSGASASTRARPRSHSPVTFVAFDLLYDRFESVMDRPLVDRRDRLATILAKAAGPRLAVSESQVGDGLALFEHVNQMKLEGVVAKRLDGPYEPGRRSGSWSKFKRRQSIVCVIIGYLPSTTGGLKSLLLAADVEGNPRFIGQVGTGIPAELHHKLLGQFPKLAQQKPNLPCTVKVARWLRPELFCRVSFMEWTNDQKLRAPVFESML
jgi:bifunctional non-homologous end joining protein LigD